MSSDFSDLKEGDYEAVGRQRFVTQLFDDLAPKYDRFNRWVSLNRDERWRRQAVARLNDRAKGVILDLAAGTGDLARSAAVAGCSHVHVFDISHAMLLQAQLKFQTNSKPAIASFELGSAHQLPFFDAAFDGIVSGFAMRNVFHFLDDVLREMHRILKPGGRFAILELSRPANPLIRRGFELHMRTITPIVGKLLAGKAGPFHYLSKTTRTFLSPSEFQSRLELAGFSNVSWQPFLLGGVAIHFGEKTH